MRFLRISPALIVALSIIGCGGGGSPTAPPAGGATLAGSMQISGQTKAPVVTSTGGTNGFGIVGNISQAAIAHATPVADESEIAFSMNGPNGFTIGAINPDGTGFREVVSGLGGAVYDIKFNPKDNYLYYIRSGNLQRIAPNGTLPATILASVTSYAFTPSGDKIFYRGYTNELKLANANGSGVTTVATPAAPFTIIGCGTENLGIMRSSTGYFVNQPLGGGSYFGATTYPTSHTWGTFDPISGEVLMERNASGTLYRTTGYWTAASSVGGYVEHGGPQTTTIAAAFAPGAQKLVLARINPSGGYGASQVYLGSRDAYATATLKEAYGVYTVAWSPFLPKRPVIGAGTSYPGGAGALLFAQIDGAVRGVVVADAVTRSSMAVTNMTQPGGDLMFDLSCDNLSKLYAASAHGHVQVPIVSAVSGLKGAIVSFSASTGRVGAVVTYSKRPLVQRAGGGYKLVGGEMVDVFDGEGKREPVGNRPSIELK